MKKKIMTAFCCLSMLALTACGKKDIMTEPPAIALHVTSDDSSVISIEPSGYTWTYLSSPDQAVSSVADSADPLAEGAPWEVLTIPDNAPEGTFNNVSEAVEYSVSYPGCPDEIGIRAWDIADMGKNSMDCPVKESSVYGREDLTPDAFSLLLQPGRIYDVYLKWDKEKVEENGFYGIASYNFRTAGETDDELPAAQDNEAVSAVSSGTVLSVDDSFALIAADKETGDEIYREAGMFDSQYGDYGYGAVLEKYTGLDIEKDENQMIEDELCYSLQLINSDGQTAQTIDFPKFAKYYIYIDGVRYLDKGKGTTAELFLAVDNLFTEEDVPTASFGGIAAGQVDEIDGVTMTASYATAKGVNLVFTNSTDKEFMYGDDYALQAWKDGQWHEVNHIIDNYAFNSIGYMLLKDAVNHWDVKWTYFHGILPDGHYRIVKSIDSDSDGTEDLAKYNLAAEFDVGER